LEFC